MLQNLVESLNDTDGLVWGLYYHLWKKTHKGLPCPDINIPHTVGRGCGLLCATCLFMGMHACNSALKRTCPLRLQVLYQDSDPIAWYFTSLKENKVSFVRIHAGHVLHGALNVTHAPC